MVCHLRSTLRSLALVFLLAVPARVLADTYIYCGLLPGCGSADAPAPFQDYTASVLRLIITDIPIYAYAFGVLFVMLGGAYMVMSGAGKEDWVNKGKQTITWAIIGIAVTTFAAQLVNFVASGSEDIRTRALSSNIVFGINNALISIIFDVLYVVIVGISIFSGMRMVLSEGKEEGFNKGKDALFWCAVGAIIINMADAIVTAFATI